MYFVGKKKTGPKVLAYHYSIMYVFNLHVIVTLYNLDIKDCIEIVLLTLKI